MKTKSQNSADSDLNSRAIQVRVHSGSFQLDRYLIFRDIDYRGYADAPSQEFSVLDGYLVLGDNVSISEDSRNAGNYSIDGRVRAEAVRGIVEQPRNMLDSLLRQAETTFLNR
jgi:hypothetical protein